MSQREQFEQLLTTVVRAIVGFPTYAISYVLGFFVILTEVEMTTLAIIGVLVGIALSSAIWGFVVFFAAYLLIKSLNNVITVSLAIRELAGTVARSRQK